MRFSCLRRMARCSSDHRPVSIAPASGPSRLDRVRAVTPQTLAAPPAEDWLHWRRTYDAWGHSPLKQISRGNIGGLQLAWAWSLPPGGNMMQHLPSIQWNRGTYDYQNPDGTVSIEAEGPAEALDALQMWCQHGPPIARVTKVEAKPGSVEGYTDFEVKRGA